MASLPKKLKKDAIAEALFEIRFDSPELSEVVIGRLNDVEDWKQYKSKRLPASQLPDVIRENDEAVRYSPIIERHNAERNMSIRIGPHVLSIHSYKPYPGWEIFEADIRRTVEHLFSKISDVVVNRLGLRYINLIESGAHLIKGFSELELNIQLKTGPLNQRLNLTYTEQLSDDIIVQSRVASPEYIQGPDIPADVSAAIDIDVRTPDLFVSRSSTEVINWSKKAHDFEKESFFKLIPDHIINELKE